MKFPNTTAFKLFSISAICVAALTACGGGDGGSSNGNGNGNGASTLQLSGQAAKGPMRGALITAATWTGSAWNDIPGATATTGSDGKFSLSIPQQTAPVRLTVKHQAGAQMFNEALAAWEAMPANFEMRSVLNPAGATTLTAGINPFTEFAAAALGSSVSASAIESLNALASRIAGEDIFSVQADETPDSPFELAMQSLLNNAGAGCDSACAVGKLAQTGSNLLVNGVVDVNQLSTLQGAVTSLGLNVTGNLSTPASNDPRYGYGGKVISAGTAFPLQDAPADYTQSQANYFLFEVTNKQDFATAQFYTAGKLIKNANEQGVDFTRFAVKTTDAWKTYGFSESRYLRQFDNGNVIVTCQKPSLAGNAAGSEQTIVAISDKAQVVDPKELYGKTLVEYTCGVDQENWADFTKNNKSPFDFTTELTISSTGFVNDGGTQIPIAPFFSKDGYSEGADFHTYITAYKLNGTYYMVMKDRDEERKGNTSRYGVALAVLK